MAQKYMYGWRKQLPDPRDYRYEARLGYKVTPERLPAEVDLSNLILRVKDQNPLGSCVAHGVTSAFEALQVARTGADFPGCRKEVYQNARIVGGYYPGDNGCNIRDGVKATVKYGVAHESLWPYQPTSDFDAPIKSNVVTDALKAESTNYYLLDGANSTEKINNIWNCLATTKLPVVFGMPVFQQYEEVGSNGIIEMPGPNEGEIGGHCNMFFGRTADGFYKSLNSWTVNWGAPFGKFKGGSCLIPEAYVKKYVSDCWVVAAESEINPNPTPPVAAEGTNPATCEFGGKTYAFVQGSNQALYMMVTSDPTPKWTNLGGILTSGPACFATESGITVFVRGSDKGLYGKTMINGVWSAWKGYGGVIA